MNDLRTAAQQALEALDGLYLPGELERVNAAITALRAALAQQAEPLNLSDSAVRKRLASQWGYVPAAAQAEPVQDSGFWGRVAARQASRIKQLETAAQQALEALRELLPDERDPNCGGYDARDVRQWRATATALRAALAQQAEPVELGAWVASKDGRVIYDDASTDDGLLRVSGDFENDEQRIRYAQRIVDKLNAAPPKAEPVQEPVAKCIDDICSEHLGRVEAFDHLPKGTLLYTIFPRRTMVPLTEEEIDAEWHELDGRASALFKRVIRKFARAVEKASWEKNNGQA